MKNEFDEIILNVVDNKITQVTFIKNCIILFVEPYEPKFHNKYLNLDITNYKFNNKIK